MRALRVALSPVLLTLGASPAGAHDTWWAPQPTTERGEVVLALGTGNRFAVQDSPIPVQQVLQSGCVAIAGSNPGRTWPLRWLADRPDSLVLRTTRPVPASTALSCWAQMAPVELLIDRPETVQAYLSEIRATAAVRERWATLQARGVRWQETFTKHARIALNPASPSPVPTTEPAGERNALPAVTAVVLGMDVRIDASTRPLRVGDTLHAQVLRDGQPLAGLAVELLNDLSPLGLWRTTDAEGRLQITLPLAARWLLRGVDLRPSPQHADHWDSRFVTLAFEVLPGARP